MVKPYTGYDEDGNPQSDEEYLGQSAGCLPVFVGLIAFVTFYIVHTL